MDYRDCIEDLYSLVDYERLVDYPHRFDLSAYRTFLESVGSPHERLQRPVIVTGTKGKGSTAEILASCLMANGIKTGVFTSPHVLDMRERIRVNGEKIPTGAFSSIYREMRPFVKRQPGGYRTVFEVLTAVAFEHFIRQGVKCSVVEVGMGGRNDATNVVSPVLSLVTPISLDHTHVLGNTVKEIAERKMGVARKGISVVSAPQSWEALGVIESICDRLGSRLELVGRDLHYSVLESTLNGSRFEIESREYNIPLLGEHQVENAATAYLALRALGEEVSEEGFERVALKGRLQIVEHNPFVVLDAAHNGHSAAVLAKSVKDLFAGKRVAAVVSMLRKKDHEGFARELSPAVDRVYASAVDSPRCLPAEELAPHFKKIGVPVEVVSDAKEACRRAKNWVQSDGLVLVTGSFYLVGEIMRETGSA